MPKDLSDIEGRELAGRFKLRRLMGRGGYGAVFEAEQLSVGRQCAVKVLAPSNGETDRVVARFRVEARATSRLNHPNTVVLYDFGRDEEADLLFLAMEYLDGRDLRAMIEDGPIALDSALHIASQVAASLDDANAQGIVHRDVKPHNVMVTTRGNDPLFVKVIDFGIAKAFADNVRSTFQQLTMSGAIVGTPAYMSPEQVRGLALDGRSDQYSLAVCVYAMLTGRPPYRGSSPIDVATKHLTDRPPRVRTLNPRLQVTDAFEDVLLRAMSREPDDRFATSSAFVERLRESLQQTDEHLEPATAPMAAQVVTSEEAFAETERIESDEVSVSTARLGAATGPVVHDASVRITGAIPPATAAPSGMFSGSTVIPDEPGHTEAIETIEPQDARPQASIQPRLKVGAGVALLSLALMVFLAVVVTMRDGGLAQEGPQSIGAPRSDDVVTAAPVAPGTDKSAPDIQEPSLEAAPSQSVIDAVDPIPPAKKDASPVDLSATLQPAVDTAILKEAKPVAKEPAKVKARVQVYVRPWGVLYVDGRRRGERLRYDIRLNTGKHQFVVKQNGTTKARKTVDVREGQTTMVELNAH